MPQDPWPPVLTCVCTHAYIQAPTQLQIIKDKFLKKELPPMTQLEASAMSTSDR